MHVDRAEIAAVRTQRGIDRIVGAGCVVNSDIREADSRRIVLHFNFIEEALREAERQQIESLSDPPGDRLLIRQPVTQVEDECRAERIDIVQHNAVAGLDRLRANGLALEWDRRIELAITIPADEETMVLTEVVIYAGQERFVASIDVLRREVIVAAVSGPGLIG